MEELMKFLSKNVAKKDVTIVVGNKMIVAKAKEIKILNALNRPQKKAGGFSNSAICPLNDGKLYIFTNFIGFSNSDDNGYCLVIVKNWTPELLMQINLLGMFNASEIGLGFPV